MKKVFLLLSLVLIGFVVCSANTKYDQVLREPKGVFDLQANTKSNFEFPVTNYGISFLDITGNKAGGFWPRGSKNVYFFGSGFWFGCLKWIDADSLNGNDTVKYKKRNKMVEVSYNPNSGHSWLVPGRITDGDEIDMFEQNKYRLYFSTDMNESGDALNAGDGPNWPLWKTGNSTLEKLGLYVDVENRNLNTFPQGPAIYSDEDIFCTYKDTDLNYYEGGANFRKNIGYPMGVQYEQTIFSWVDEDKKDMIIMFYKIINTSKDTLQQSWFSPIFDIDILVAPNYMNGASNDHAAYYWDEPYLNMAYAWSDSNKGEAGNGLGYVGITMILSPVVGVNGRPDNAKLFDANYDPIGLRTYKNWSIMEDYQEDAARYEFLSSNVFDGDDGPGDKRMLMASGPFDLHPGDTAMFAVQINFALPTKGGEPDGTAEDTKNLVRKVKTGKDFFLKEMLTNILENNPNHKDFEVYPNPANDIIYMNYQSNAIKPIIKIYDILGNEVYTGNANSNGKFIQQNIDFLQTGTYIICIIDEKNVISNKISVIK